MREIKVYGVIGVNEYRIYRPLGQGPIAHSFQFRMGKVNQCENFNMVEKKHLKI